MTRELAIAACRELGLEFWDVSLERQGKTLTLLVTADREGGLTLADCEALSQRLSEKLDEVDPIPESYNLDVASPGPERKLRHLGDVHRFEGKRALVVLRPEGTERRRYTGVLQGVVGEDRFRLAGDDGAVYTFRWSDVERANLKPVFGKGERR